VYTRDEPEQGTTENISQGGPEAKLQLHNEAYLLPEKIMELRIRGVSLRCIKTHYSGERRSWRYYIRMMTLWTGIEDAEELTRPITG
jgi:hypothetical protein